MSIPRVFAAAAALVAMVSCARPGAPTRGEAVRTAYAYSQVRWLPEERNVLHGPDKNGIDVQTPDSSIGKRGWWRPGKPATGMPYKWGGTDTPKSFLAAVKKGHPAGDIATPEKRRLGDAAVSRESCGIDCSGLVSACWNLPRACSTRELPGICDRLGSWSDLKAGDIILNDKHVLLFAKRIRRSDGTPLLGCYEAGPMPVWRVNACGLAAGFLEKEGYAPWRYQKIREDAPEKPGAPPAVRFPPRSPGAGW